MRNDYRIRALEAELLIKRENEFEEMAHLEKAMEQVEDNLKRSTVSTETNTFILNFNYVNINYIFQNFRKLEKNIFIKQFYFLLNYYGFFARLFQRFKV